MFQKLTVAKRLALGYGAMVAVIVGLATFAVMTMNLLKQEVEELASERMVKVLLVVEAQQQMESVTRFARNIIIKNEPAFVEAEKKRVTTARKKYRDALSALERKISAPNERELMQRIGEHLGAYEAALDQAVLLGAQGDREAATAQLFGEVRKIQNTHVFKTMDEFSELQQQGAQSALTRSKDLMASRTTAMLVFAAIASALGAGVGWMLSRNLRVALGAEPVALSEAVSKVADGDLTQNLVVKPGDTSSVMASVARMRANLASVVANVRANSESVAAASAQIALGNQDLSQRTEMQASALQKTAATAEQLGTTVRHNTDSAEQANLLAQSASAVASQGGEVVNRVVSTMQGISDSSKKIGDIIGVIDAIAFQTNILALNAAVEAARAGEQGRGFAVVASEVRGLAQRSAEAAKEIKALISRSVEQVEQGSDLVDQAGKTMEEIVGSIRRVSDIVAEISFASQEQSSGISQVGDAVKKMDHVTQQNAALVEESAAAAASLKSQAQDLVQAVAIFKLGEDTCVDSRFGQHLPGSA